MAKRNKISEDINNLTVYCRIFHKVSYDYFHLCNLSNPMST